MADRSAGTAAGVSPHYAAAFERVLLGGSAARRLDPLEARRREAFDRFAATGFPTTKQEDWRFTPVAAITRREWDLDGSGAGRLGGSAVTADRLAPLRLGEPSGCTLVFVDGVFSPELSHRPPLAGGITVEPLAEALERDPATVERVFARIATPEVTSFGALNAALAQEGAVVRVAAEARIAEPIHLVFLATPAAEGRALLTRTLVVVERWAHAQVIESYVGLGRTASFTNAVTEVMVGEAAWVEHTRIQRESEAAYHIGLTAVHQERDSHYRSFTLAAGGTISRHDLQARLGGENVETLLYGLYLGRGEQLVDNHTAIFHEHPNCRSWEVYKGILDDRSHAVFNGKVLVRPAAQQTDAKQTNRNLLLSEGAKVDTKPQLEIFADDVKCTHGAAVGQIDEMAYFYLQSRGIARAEARRILTYAFAAEVVDEVASAPVREALDRLVRERLGDRQARGET
ncbi:MAG: Fe-S cluster assembly protein SufD [Gemmatimonadales bacterium]